MVGNEMHQNIKVRFNVSHNAGKAMGQMTKTMTRFGNVAAKVSLLGEGSWDRWGMSMMMAGSILTSMGENAIRTFNEWIGVSNEFNLKMAETAALLGDASDQAYNASDAVKSMSAEFGQKAATQAKGYYNVISAGVTDSAQSLSTLRLATKAASAGVTSVDIAVRAGIYQMRAYGLEVDALNRIYDIQFSIIKYGVITYRELAPVIGDLSTRASLAGQSMDTMAASLATLTRVGPPAKAATNLGRLFENLTRVTTAGDKALKSLNVRLYDNNDNMRSMIDIVNDLKAGLKGKSDMEKNAAINAIFTRTQARKAIVALMAQSETLNDLSGTMGEAGTMSDAFGHIQGTSAFKLAQLQAELENARIELAVGFIPAQLAVIELQIKFINALDSTRKTLNDLYGGLGDATAGLLYYGAALAQMLGPIVQQIGMSIILWQTIKMNTHARAQNTVAVAAETTAIATKTTATNVETVSIWARIGAGIKSIFVRIKEHLALNALMVSQFGYTTTLRLNTATLWSNITARVTSTGATIKATIAEWAHNAAVLFKTSLLWLAIVATAAYTAAMWGLTVGVFAAAAAVKAFTLALLASPLFPIIIIILALAAVFIYWDDIVSGLTWTWLQLNDALHVWWGMLLGIGDAIAPIIKALEPLAEVLERIGDALKATGDFMGGVGHGINPVNWFGEGGVVNRPTIVGVGDRGAEAMIPLKNGNVPVKFTGGGGGMGGGTTIGEINITIQTESVDEGSVDGLARKLAEKIKLETMR